MTMAVNSVLATSMLVEALKDDEEVTAEIKKLALKAIAEANYLLEHSTPSVKIQVIKSIMPAVARALQVSNTDTELSQVKNEIREMIAEMMGKKVDIMENPDTD